MTPKMRHFKIENGKATIDKDGEFLHINDIVLLIVEERRSLQGMIDVLPKDESDWSKKSKYAYEQQIKMLDEMKQRIERGN
jgi:hypothetical protein